MEEEKNKQHSHSESEEEIYLEEFEGDCEKCIDNIKPKVCSICEP